MWLLPILAPIASASVVDRIVVVVDDRLILASDLQLDEALSPLDQSPIPMWSRLTPLERQINAALFRSAAGNISLYQPSTTAVNQRIQVIRSHFSTDSAWMSFLHNRGLREQDLRSVVDAREMVDLFLRRNIPLDPQEDPKGFQRATLALSDALRAQARIRRIEPR